MDCRLLAFVAVGPAFFPAGAIGVLLAAFGGAEDFTLYVPPLWVLPCCAKALQLRPKSAVAANVAVIAVVINAVVINERFIISPLGVVIRPS